MGTALLIIHWQNDISSTVILIIWSLLSGEIFLAPNAFSFIIEEIRNFFASFALQRSVPPDSVRMQVFVTMVPTVQCVGQYCIHSTKHCLVQQIFHVFDSALILADVNPNSIIRRSSQLAVKAVKVHARGHVYHVSASRTN